MKIFFLGILMLLVVANVNAQSKYVGSWYAKTSDKKPAFTINNEGQVSFTIVKANACDKSITANLLGDKIIATESMKCGLSSPTITTFSYSLFLNSDGELIVSDPFNNIEKKYVRGVEMKGLVQKDNMLTHWQYNYFDRKGIDLKNYNWNEPAINTAILDVLKARKTIRKKEAMNLLYVGIGASVTYYGLHLMTKGTNRSQGEFIIGTSTMPLGATFGLLFAFNIGHANKEHRGGLNKNINKIHQYINNPLR